VAGGLDRDTAGVAGAVLGDRALAALLVGAALRGEIVEVELGEPAAAVARPRLGGTGEAQLPAAEELGQSVALGQEVPAHVLAGAGADEVAEALLGWVGNAHDGELPGGEQAARGGRRRGAVAFDAVSYVSPRRPGAGRS
jgi:hypothetical protein